MSTSASEFYVGQHVRVKETHVPTVIQPGDTGVVTFVHDGEDAYVSVRPDHPRKTPRRAAYTFNLYEVEPVEATPTAGDGDPLDYADYLEERAERMKDRVAEIRKAHQARTMTLTVMVSERLVREARDGLRSKENFVKLLGEQAGRSAFRLLEREDLGQEAYDEIRERLEGS